MTVTTHAPLDLRHLFRDGHAEAAAVHAALHIGLIEAVTPGASTTRVAQRCGATATATEVLLRVLRVGAVVTGDSERGWTCGPDITDATRAEALRAARAAAVGWADLGAPGAHDEFAAVPGPPVTDPGPEWLLDRAWWGHVRTRAASAAAEMGVFAALAGGPMPAAALAEHTGAPIGDLMPVLVALSRVGVLVEAADGIAAAPALAAALSARRGVEAVELGAALAHEYWTPLGGLADAVRTGALTLDLHDPDVAGRYYGRLARYNSLSFPGYFRVSRAVATAVSAARADVATIVDAGAGSGVWGVAFAAVVPGATVTFLDREQVLAQARRNAEKLGIADRAAFTPVDLTTGELGDGTADLLTLGQVCHTQPRTELPALLRRCARALRPGGVLVLAELILDADETKPVPYLHFAVKELISTGGEVFGFPGYADLVRDAGFGDLRWFRIDGLDVLLAVRGCDGVLPDTVPGAERLA